jgi:hypothetical protein
MIKFKWISKLNSLMINFNRINRICKKQKEKIMNCVNKYNKMIKKLKIFSINYMKK